MSFIVDIATPSQTIVKEQVAVKVEVPTVNGPILLLPSHCDLIELTSIGLMTIEHGDVKQYYVIGDGVCSVRANKISILSDFVDTPDTCKDLEYGIALKNIEKERQEYSGSDPEIQNSLANKLKRLESKQLLKQKLGK